MHAHATPVSGRFDVRGGGRRGGRFGELGCWRPTKSPPVKSPNEKLGVAVVGCGGRGGDHLETFVEPRRHRSAVRRRRRRKHRPAAGPSTVAEKQGREPKIVADMREAFDDKSGRHRQHRHAQPLARAGQHLGHAGRQGRVRREAGQPQRQRRPADGRSGPQVQQDLPDRHAMPLEQGHAGRDASTCTTARSARSTSPAACATSAGRRSARWATIRFPRASTTICGSARRQYAPLTRPQSALRLAHAVSLRQRRPGQPGHPPDGPVPLGLGRRQAEQLGAQLRRPAGL